MYLKSLEMSGFKSFADKTVLTFEPGMTCIVGPNGCGKSNVSDAVRWVLGEQSAKALRGSKMEDCIFNGTDDRKPLGMAEVGITFADCEQSLGTEYNEVTITRRVFRSGEGQYFLNKTPCRLKDVQRLFMDTGIGTDSYSLMEQGRIDQILSSRPEDRRTVFEEASGITKFKTDKKEALRKLEHTEANLLRLSDVIREVHRQIGSLQRQAGKARRYKEFREELRLLDIFATNCRLGAMDGDIRGIEAEIENVNGKIAAANREIMEMEEGSAALRQSVVQTEHEIGTTLELAVQAQSRLDHTRELIGLNRQRIEEYRALSDRGTREIEETARQVAEKRRDLRQMDAQMAEARSELAAAEGQLADCSLDHEAGRKRVESLRDRLRRLRDDSVETESLLTRLQNQLVELDSRGRNAAIGRERLAAEKAQLSRDVHAFEKRHAETAGALARLAEEAAGQQARLDATTAEREANLRDIASAQRDLADIDAREAATEARIDLLGRSRAASPELPAALRAAIDRAGSAAGSGAVPGVLSSLLNVDSDYAVAADAVLRAAADAVLVRDSSLALELLGRAAAARDGSVRMVALDRVGAPRPAPTGHRLLAHVRCPDAIRPVLEVLIGHVLVADDIDRIPSPVPPGTAYVTRDGVVMGGDGWMELWDPAPGQVAPLTWDAMLAQSREELQALRLARSGCAQRISASQSAAATLEESLRAARQERDASARALAHKEGESLVVEKEASDARVRLDTVSWELAEIESRKDSGESERGRTTREIEGLRGQREAITAQSGQAAGDLQKAESELSALLAQLTERRIRVAELRQKAENVAGLHEAARSRIMELETSSQGRSQDLVSYKDRIRALEEAIASSESSLAELDATAGAHQAKAGNLRRNRQKQSDELEKLDRYLSQRRAAHEELRNLKSGLQVRIAETRVRRQNHSDRVMSEYGMTDEQMAQAPEPPWPEGRRPSLEAVETMVAELRTKIEAMGPVNLVAIEEYKELEERHNFLTAQEMDLVNSKEQLKEMIRKINRTTTEMFRATFDQANANFQAMFQKLFNGGSARLVLVNEEDVLECGIEIIARPPGKRLQNVSLLSGGERTLTAVALLFAIYMIKPSPFCMLDELDAALDDSNIIRFVKSLKDFMEQSQFVVITHNRQTIAAGRTLYGVTMAEKGVSSIVSMKFKDYKGEGAPARTPAPSPDPAPEPAKT
ncbi:MAG: chromosome segregation protein SMC [Lentisphaerae bacterium]|nr:chromosome segregation protein SMC [Lentisphaerota bacterium]